MKYYLIDFYTQFYKESSGDLSKFAKAHRMSEESTVMLLELGRYYHDMNFVNSEKQSIKL